MQEKIIQIKFNRTFFVTAQKVIWNFTYRNAIKQYIYMSIATIIFVALTFGFGNKNEFSFDKMISSGFVIYMGLLWLDLIGRRIKLATRIRSISTRFEKEEMDCTYIFNDDGFAYKDKEKSMNFSWHLFKPFEAYKGHIFVKTKDTNAIILHLSHQELGDFDYDEVYNLLKEKIG